MKWLGDDEDDDDDDDDDAEYGVVCMDEDDDVDDDDSDRGIILSRCMHTLCSSCMYALSTSTALCRCKLPLHPHDIALLCGQDIVDIASSLQTQSYFKASNSGSVCIACHHINQLQ